MKKYLFLSFGKYRPVDFGAIKYITAEYDPDYCTKPEDFFNLRSEITVDQDEKFYFLPGVSIPRIKLKDLYASTKSKTVRDASDATRIIFGSKTAHTLIETRWYCTAQKIAIRELLDIAFAQGDIGELTYDSMSDVLNNYQEDIVIGSYDLRNVLDSYNIDKTLYSTYNTSFLQVKDDYVELYDSIKDKTLYDEKSLISIVNGGDSTVIDEAMYNTLVDMFESSDKDNWVLAMEIMANSNYTQSLIYLCFLFEKYSNKISNEKTRNHVNFKSLCSYMGFSSPTYCHLYIDGIMERLLKHDVLTKELAMRFLQEYRSRVEESGNTQFIKISRITLNDEVMNYLKEKEAKNEPECAE